MCSRYRLIKEKIVLTINGREVEVTVVRRHSLSPQQTMPVLVPELPAIRAVEMKWGWRPPWGGQLLINARAEGIREKAAFKKLLRQRCLVPADGFYEWTTAKVPMLFTKPGQAVFCFAGLWEEVAAAEPSAGSGAPGKSFVLLTTTPNESVGQVHSRMPFIVRPEHYGAWLDDQLFPGVLTAPDREELAVLPMQRDLTGPLMPPEAPPQQGELSFG